MNEMLIKYRIHENNTIGTNDGNSLKKSILNYDRKDRSEEAQKLLVTLNKLRITYNFKDRDSIRAIKYIESRHNFYEHPSFIKYVKMKNFDEYNHTTNRKGRLWDLLAVTGITDLAFRIVKN